MSEEFNLTIDVITEKHIEPHIANTSRLNYIACTNIFPNSINLNLYPYAFFYILKHRPAAVLALPNASNLTELLIAFLCKILNVRLVYWTHGYDHCRRPNHGFWHWIERTRVVIVNSFVRNASAVITFSPSGKTYLVKEGVDEVKIFVANNTLDTETLLAQADSIDLPRLDAFKAALRIQGKTVFLFSGRLLAGKKLENFIEALGRSNLCERSTLLVVGDGPEMPKLRALAADSNISVHFFGAEFNEEKLALIFSASDWFVMPGYVGLAVVHAFSFSLPVITEDISYHSPEIFYLQDGHNGFLIPEDDVSAWVTFIENTAHQKDTRHRLAANARQTVETIASINNQIRQMAAALGVGNVQV